MCLLFSSIFDVVPPYVWREQRDPIEPACLDPRPFHVMPSGGGGGVENDVALRGIYNTTRV